MTTPWCEIVTKRTSSDTQKANAFEKLGGLAFGNEKAATEIVSFPGILPALVQALNHEILHYHSMIVVVNLMCNSNNARPILARESEILDRLCQYANDQDESHHDMSMFALSFMSHNKDASPFMEEKQISTIFAKVMQDPSETQSNQVLAMMGLANLTGREEQSRFTADTGLLEQLLDIFGRALGCETFAGLVWVPQYVLPALVSLSVSDSIKKPLIQLGIFPHLLRLEKEGSKHFNKFPKLVNLQLEREYSAQILFNLALSNEGSSFLGSHSSWPWLLEKFSSESSTAVCKDHAERIQFRIRKWKEVTEPQPQTSRNRSVFQFLSKTKKDDPSGSLSAAEAASTSTTYTMPLVMISYNWAHQEMIKKIAAGLKQYNFRIWLDIEHMSGSTVEAMANAVESADVILVCVSKAYKESANCALEAQYAMQLRKPTVPLIMEDNYRPGTHQMGWLGMLCGTKLYYDFSRATTPDTFKAKLAELVVELTPKNVPVPIAPKTIPEAQTETKVEMTVDQVVEWVREVGLGEYADRFVAHQMDGAAMRSLAKCIDNVGWPELRASLGIDSLGDRLRLRALLHAKFQ